MTVARRDSGFSLIELLLAMTLALLVLGATLAVFARAERGHRDNQRQNEAQDQVRFATDTLARRLRNLASPTDAGATPEQPLERAEPQDLIFRTVNSAGAANPATNPHNLQRYRYCLSVDERRLYVQRQTWSTTADPGMPTGTSCPASGWSETSVTAASITNDDRSVFTYELSPVGSMTEQTSVAPADFASVVAIGTRLFVDPLPTRAPKESTLTTRVFLRNQNRAPTASFTATPITGTSVQLNGMDSDDPEGGRLSFAWFVDGVKLANTSATPTVTLAAGTHTVYLEVTDVGNLSAQSITRTTTCSSTACAPFTP
jgi:prepilin-type N-terminal cleavage/methylation domain-containing protein